MKARTDQARTVIIGEARSPVGVSLGLRLIGDEEVATITLTQHDKTVTLYVADQAHAAQIAAAIQGHPPLAAEAPRAEAKATAMTDYQLVPLPPTAEMVSAAEDAYMPFGDMEMAIRMAVLAAPAVQGEIGEGVPATYLRKDQLESLVVELPPLPQEAEARSMHYACRRALERVGVRVNIAPQPGENDHFDAFWSAPEQEELRMSCAKGWALAVWKASRASMVVKLPTLPPPGVTSYAARKAASDMHARFRLAITAAGGRVKV